MATVRGLIREIQAEVRDTDLQPDRAADLLNRLSALLGNVLDEVRASEMDYKRVLLASLNTHEAANRARIEAEVSPEYARWQEAKHANTLTVEMIRSLKAFLKAKAEEMRLT